MRIMTQGAEEFRKWRDGQSLTQREVAALLEVAPIVVSMYERGHRRPSLALAVVIEDVTNGAVTARMWTEVV